MLFSALPQHLQDELRSESPISRFDEGQLIQQRGEEAAGFWLTESGSVTVGQFLRSGEFRGVAVLGPGDSWGELALFAGRPRVVDAIARTRCEVRHILATRFEAALRNDPWCMRPLLGALSGQFQEVLDVFAGIRRGTAAARVAGLLATLAGEAADCVKLEISQQELGELLGLTRATVNTALRDHEAQGRIRRFYGGVEVIDRDALQQASLE